MYIKTKGKWKRKYFYIIDSNLIWVPKEVCL